MSNTFVSLINVAIPLVIGVCIVFALVLVFTGTKKEC